jgi:ssDNA-binding Zn-finger/Zn-ribbon topoisomerase 1
MAIRRGRFGAFLACTGYPACKTTRPLPTGVKCPRPGCGGDIVERRMRNGRNYWECTRRVRLAKADEGAKGAKAAAKPDEGAKGAKAAAKSAAKSAGKAAAKSAAKAAAKAAMKPAATAEPERPNDCDFVAWRKPVAQACPQCGAPYLVEAKVRGALVLVCDNKECGYRAPVAGETAEATAGS